MRAIGEPIHGRTAEEISMADLLGQLFAYTDVFDMETRPELILLQKSMVIVEGVARGLDPNLNVWTASEPIAREWVENNLGPLGRLKEAGAGAQTIGELILKTPGLLQQAQSAAQGFAAMARDGIRLDEATLKKISQGQKTTDRLARTGFILAALSFGALLLKHFGII